MTDSAPGREVKRLVKALEANDGQRHQSLLQWSSTLLAKLSAVAAAASSALSQPTPDPQAAAGPDSAATATAAPAVSLQVPPELQRAQLAATLQAAQQGWGAATPSEFENLAISEFLGRFSSPPSAPISQIVALFHELEPEMTVEEVALLEPHERVVTNTNSLPTFPFEPSTWNTAVLDLPERSRPTVWDPDPWGADRDRFEQFEEVLQFQTIENPHASHPTVAVDKVEAPSGCFTNYLFEFDTTAEFDTPNCWRTPNLLTKRVHPKPNDAPRDGAGDLWDRSQLRAALNICTDRTPGTNSVTFPFTAAAMSLPNSFVDLDQTELIRIAAVLGSHVSPTETAGEIYEFVRHFYLEAPTVGHRTPVDTFRTGIGQCGFVNGLAALLAELNGIPTRRVSGFSPLARPFRPGGGHSATEIYLDDHWSYWDPYLDIFAPGVGVEEIRIGGSGSSSIPVFVIDEVHDDSVPNPVTLRDLFRFRNHGDYFERFPAVSFSTGDRSLVGLNCERPTLAQNTLGVGPTTIFVRAAAVFTRDAPMRLARSWEPLPAVVGATQWASTSFVHDPSWGR